MRLSSVAVIAIVVCGIAMHVSAQPVPSTQPVMASSVAATHPEVARVEAYLTGLTTLVSDFTQTTPDGKVSKGTFFLQRPGKMRWEYKTPKPLLLISDGKVISYKDVELNQVNYIGVDETLASFLTRKDIKLDSPQIQLVSFTSENGVIRAKMIQRGKPSEGSLTLELSANPIGIRHMEMVDQNGQIARVELENARFGEALDRKLFVLSQQTPATRRN